MNMSPHFFLKLNVFMRLISFILVIILFIGNLRYLYVNEEYMIFFSLLNFFIIFFHYTRKGILVYFYKEFKSMFLRFLFLLNINTELIFHIEANLLVIEHQNDVIYIGEFLIVLMRIILELWRFQKFMFLYTFNFWTKVFLSNFKIFFQNFLKLLIIVVSSSYFFLDIIFYDGKIISNLIMYLC